MASDSSHSVISSVSSLTPSSQPVQGAAQGCPGPFPPPAAASTPHTGLPLTRGAASQQRAAPLTTAALLLTPSDIPPEPGGSSGILSAATPYTHERGAGARRLAAKNDENGGDSGSNIEKDFEEEPDHDFGAEDFDPHGLRHETGHRPNIQSETENKTEPFTEPEPEAEPETENERDEPDKEDKHDEYEPDEPDKEDNDESEEAPAPEAGLCQGLPDLDLDLGDGDGSLAFTDYGDGAQGGDVQDGHGAEGDIPAAWMASVTTLALIAREGKRR